jgi:tRNA 2-thiouridine synthesizing protein D
MKRHTSLTIVLMDAPFESDRTTTAMRILAVAAKRGYDINVFAYEGAVLLPSSRQRAHANALDEHGIDEQAHPLPKDWVAALIADASRNGGQLDWVNCGLCVDERGVDEVVNGARRGTPADLVFFSRQSSNTLVIPTA